MHQTLIPSQDTETELQAFVREHHLAGYIESACQLIDELFTVEGPIIIEKKEDPEFPDEWVSLRIKVLGNLDSVVESYNKFTAGMVTIVPAESSRKISLSLGMA